MEELAADARRENTEAICAEAQAAVEEMQKAMAAAPEGLATTRPAKEHARKALPRPVPMGGTSAPLG
jgi:hypothetical protein